MNYILAIDQGTTSTTALIINHHGHIVSEGSVEIPQHFPKMGFVEHHAEEIKKSVAIACGIALEKAYIKPTELLGIGITNQRETACLFEKSGSPIHPFIVWQCRRSSLICDEMKTNNLQTLVHQKTGLHLDPYFSASKLLWVFREHPNLLARAQMGQVLFGTIDSYLSHWLSGGALHITDVTNASRTMLMDLTTQTWSDECLDIFSVPRVMLPRIVKNIGPYGVTKGVDFLPDGLPILAMAGDQHAALFGQACFDAGEAKATFGTGSFILLNTGNTPLFSKHGLITSIAYHIDDKPHYCLEGSAFVAGALIQFLRDNLGMITSAHEVDELAKTVPNSNGALFIPALCGLSAPYWQSDARGMLCGLDRGTSKAHIARAALEGIALQNTDIMLAMAKDGVRPLSIKVDGGAAQSNLLMQIQTDLLGIPCIRPDSSQKTALGAAFLAGLAAGVFKSTEDIKAIDEHKTVFIPNPHRAEADDLLNRYHHAIQKVYL